MQKLFIIIGFIFIAIGIFLPFIQRIGIGRLPGDFLFKRDNFTFYFPLTTSIILSIILTLIIWFLRK